MASLSSARLHDGLNPPGVELPGVVGLGGQGRDGVDGAAKDDLVADGDLVAHDDALDAMRPSQCLRGSTHVARVDAGANVGRRERHRVLALSLFRGLSGEPVYPQTSCTLNQGLAQKPRATTECGRCL